MQTQYSAIGYLRTVRNYVLKTTDWTQLPDSQLSEQEKAEWAAYRQQLRDMTDNVDLNNVVWPIPPGE